MLRVEVLSQDNKLINMLNTIIYDLEISGHHLEYIHHIITYFNSNCQVDRSKYYFLLHPEFMKSATDMMDAELLNDVNIIPITRKEYISIFGNDNTKNISLFKSLNAIKVLKQYAKHIKADYCIALDMDLIIKGMSISRISNIQIRGIWFKPTARIPTTSIRSKLIKYSKLIMIKSVLILNKYSEIYVLNDEYTKDQLNKSTHTNQFHTLPDPVYIFDENSDGIVSCGESLEKGKMVFLLFGSLSYRKGTLHILDIIISKLSLNVLSRIQFFFVGKVDKTISAQFYQKIKAIKNSGIASVVVVDKFIEYSQISHYFQISDYVLMPYLKFYGSSGVLNYAAYFEKPVITGADGLICDLVKKYNLGITTKLDEMSLSELISKLSIPSPIRKKNNRLSSEYLQSQLPEVFSRKLLSRS